MPSPSILPTHNGREKSQKTVDRNKHSKSRPMSFLPNRVRNEVVACCAEFAGTFMFLFFAFGATQVANTAAIVANGAAGESQESHSITQVPNTNVLLFISAAFGVSLAGNVWVYYRISGGMFNPAVTLGLYLVGAVNGVRAIGCFFAQMFAGIASAGVVSAILPGPLNVSTSLGAGTSIAQGVFLEMFLTAQLVFTIFMLAVEKHKGTFLAPLGIGLSLFVAEMMGVFYTGGSLNPARSFGPAAVVHFFPGYHWIYWLGPFMGTLLAFGMYKLVKTVEYQTVNPGQDFDDHEAELFHPPDDPEDAAQVQRPNVGAIAAQEAVSAGSLSPERTRGSGRNTKHTL